MMDKVPFSVYFVNTCDSMNPWEGAFASERFWQKQFGNFIANLPLAGTSQLSKSLFDEWIKPVWLRLLLIGTDASYKRPVQCPADDQVASGMLPLPTGCFGAISLQSYFGPRNHISKYITISPPTLF